MSKTILHFTEQLGVGGTEVLLKNTVPLLKEYQHVICYMGGADELKPSFSGYPVYSLEYRGKKDLFRSVMRLRRIIKENKVDVLHAHLFWATLIARLAKSSGVKLLSTIHSTLSKDAFEKNKLSLWAERVTVNRQDALIAVSNYALKDYLKHVSFKGTTHVLYNFIADDFFSEKIESPIFTQNGVLKCVAVGNLKAVKNYLFILAAFAALKKLPISLDIYGDGMERAHLQQVISAEKLSVQLQGVHNHLQEVLPSYQVFIQMSAYEGFGIALLEAMASGLVPVLSDIPVHREVAGDCAFFVSLTEKNSLEKALKKVLDNKEELPRRQEKCRQRAKEISSKEEYLQQLRSIYIDLTSSD